MDDARQKEYWATLALRHCPGLGARSQNRLLRIYGSALRAFDERRSWARQGVNERVIAEMRRESWRAGAHKEWENARRLNLSFILAGDGGYPALLRSLPDAPLLLYYLGDITLFQSPCMALVGSRKASPQGLSVAARLAGSLAGCGLAIVSGLAEGIDASAHRRALREIGSSIGVLGTGIDLVYPAGNRDLFAQMAEKGLIVSEFPPSTPPGPANFPIRNRIISGLSLGVVVVEAARKSGSLITARYALEQNREVFAVPGTAFDSHSLGCHELVRQGAHPVFNADDVLRELAEILKPYKLAPCVETEAEETGRGDTAPKAAEAGVTASVAASQLGAEAVGTAVGAGKMPSKNGALDEKARGIAAELISDDSDRLVALLEKEGALHVDAIAERLRLGPEELNSIILGLEMLGQIKRLPGARFAL